MHDVRFIIRAQPAVALALSARARVVAYTRARAQCSDLCTVDWDFPINTYIIVVHNHGVTQGNQPKRVS